MKARLDHIGIAVTGLADALAFYKEALGLEVSPPHDVPSEHVRAVFVPVGESSLELLEATSPDSPIGRFVERHGPGLHHITLTVPDLDAALASLESRGVRLIDRRASPRRERVARGVRAPLLGGRRAARIEAGAGGAVSATSITLGRLELRPMVDGYFALDGGAMFGVVPKTLWSRVAAPDDRNRIRMAMRPWLVTDASRQILIDAGCGDKQDAKFAEIYGFDRTRHLDHALADAGLTASDIDVVVASHLHFDHAGGFTRREADGRIVPRFPRARVSIRRGEWDDAMHPNERTRASYFRENYAPLVEAGLVDFVESDGEVAPGLSVRRTGGHTMHHEIVRIESEGKVAIFAADLLPTAAHVPLPYIMGYDLYPMDTLAFKRAFLEEAVEREYLILFEHDPVIAAGYLRRREGKIVVERAL